MVPHVRISPLYEKNPVIIPALGTCTRVTIVVLCVCYQASCYIHVPRLQVQSLVLQDSLWRFKCMYCGKKHFASFGSPALAAPLIDYRE